MAYSAIAVANAFIEKAKKLDITDLTPMKLQKLVYFAHAWSLALDGEPLIKDKILAWRYGPVIESIYYEFKKFGSNNITQFGTEFMYDDDESSIIKFKYIEPKISPDDSYANSIINAILEVYGEKSAFFLSELTHKKNGAWHVTKKNNPIPNSVIEETTKMELGLE